jgi:hypothetical protein
LLLLLLFGLALTSLLCSALLVNSPSPLEVNALMEAFVDTFASHNMRFFIELVPHDVKNRKVRDQDIHVHHLVILEHQERVRPPLRITFENPGPRQQEHVRPQINSDRNVQRDKPGPSSRVLANQEEMSRVQEQMQEVTTRTLEQHLAAGNVMIHPKWHPDKSKIDLAYFKGLILEYLPGFRDLHQVLGGDTFVRNYFDLLDLDKDSHWRALTSILIQSVVTYHMGNVGQNLTRKSECIPTML